ncbi:hypothetical protein D3C71_1882850 [compost metagenome]
MQVEVQQRYQLADQLVFRQIHRLRLGQVDHQAGAAFAIGGGEREVLQGDLRLGSQQLFQIGLDLDQLGFRQVQLG